MVNHSTSPTDFRDRRFLRDRVKELIGDAFEWYMRTSSAPDADGSRRETETRMCTAGVVMGKESAATWRQIEAYCLAINGGQRLLGDIGKLFSDEDKSAQLPDRTISTFECQDFAVRFMASDGRPDAAFFAREGSANQTAQKLFPRQPNHRVFCQGLVWHVLVSMLDNVITERIGARVINEVVHDTSDPEISTMLRGQTAFLYRRGWLCDLAGTSYFATRINP